jgi:DnaJ-class molecular chaperone
MTEDQLTKLAQELTELADDLREPCPTCGGTGLCDVEDTFECPDCDGEGWTEI